MATSIFGRSDCFADVGTSKSFFGTSGIVSNARLPTDPIFITDLNLVSLETGFGYHIYDKNGTSVTSGYYIVNPTVSSGMEAYTVADAITVYFLKYGNLYKKSTFALTNISTLMFMAQEVNSNVTEANSATVSAYMVTVNKTNKTITASGSNTSLANIYDYMQYWQSLEAQNDILFDGEILSTVLGDNYTLDSAWTIIFDAVPSGAFDVSGGSIYFNFATGTISNFNYVGTVSFDSACTITATDSQIDTLDTVDGNETVSYTPAGSSNTPTNNDATNITIVAPTYAFTINSNVSADIKVFTTTTQTIIAQATGTTVNTETSGTYDITVMAQGYLPQRQTGKVFGGTADVTIDFELISDPIYNDSHTLAYPTDLTYDRTLKELTLLDRRAGRDIYSALIDAFIDQSTLDNTPFDFQAVGIDSIFFLEDAVLATGSEDNWYDAGIRYINSSDVVTAEWCSIKSSGTIPSGVTGRYQTGQGTGTTALRVSGAVNQIIQIYKAGNFDYRNYLVIKFQANPYIDTRSDILALAGVSTLEPFEYSVAIEPTTLDITVGTGGATLTLVDHTAAPKVVGGKSFSYEIIDGGTATAEDILRTWDYNIAQAADYLTHPSFNLPEFIAQSGTTYETRQGIVESEGDTLYGCYVSRAGSDHPDFTRHQSDDGTYYVKPILADISITNLPNDGVQRLHIYNTTTATTIYNDDPAATSYTDSYTEGDAAYSSDGDTIQITFAEINAGTSFKTFRTTLTASSSGFSIDADNYIESDSVYAANAVDGTLITTFTANFAADYIEFASDTDFTAAQAYAYFCYTITTSEGIHDFFGGVTAIDSGNYRINQATLNLYFDSPTGATYSVKQTDNARIFRADDSYPVKDPTTSGYGVQLNWKNVVYVQNIGGSALTAPEQAQLTAIASSTAGLTYTDGSVHADIQAVNNVGVTGAGTEADPWNPNA